MQQSPFPYRIPTNSYKIYRYLGHLKSSWKRKCSHHLMTQNIEVLFSFPRRKMLDHLFLLPPPHLCFNHPELVASTVLKKAHVEIYFQELYSEWTLCFPLEGLRAPYTGFRRVRGGGVQNAGSSQKSVHATLRFLASRCQ